MTPRNPLVLLSTQSPVRPPTGTGLPGYVWDTRMKGGRWRRRNKDGSLGRLVSQRRITNFLRDLHAQSTIKFQKLGALVASGQISPAVFEQAMATELKALHNASAALGAGGWGTMTPAAWGRSGASLRKEYAYLHRFAQQIANGELSEAAIIHRAGLYSDNAYGRFWVEQDLAKKRFGARQEHLRTVGDDRVCEDCLAAEAQGWVAIGTIPVPVHLECRCEKTYR